MREALFEGSIKLVGRLLRVLSVTKHGIEVAWMHERIL